MKEKNHFVAVNGSKCFRQSSVVVKDGKWHFMRNRHLHSPKDFLHKLPIDNKARNDNFTVEKLPFNRVIKVNIKCVGLTDKLYLLVWCIKVKWNSLSCVQLFVTPWTTVRGILQAKMLEWVAYPFSRGSSRPRNWTGVSCIAGGFFTNWTIREAHDALRRIQYHFYDISAPDA